MQQDEKKASKTRSPRGRSPSGRMFRWPCKDHLKGTCTNSFCEKWHPPECLFYKTKSGCRFGEKCPYAHRQVDAQPGKRSKKNGDRSAVAMLKKHELHDRTVRPVVCRDTRHAQGHGPVVCRSSNTRQLGCLFQDMEPPRLSSILRKSSYMFTKTIARHTKIRDQNSSLRLICPGEPHQRSPNAPKFEDRSQEETEWQEQGAREAAWKLAKSVLKLKEKNKATFFSPLENRCLPASILKPEEREFVVDSGASMHMISKKDLKDAEMETVTVKVLEDTPAVLSLGKLCDENGYPHEWINGQKPHLIKNGTRIQCNTENFVPIVVRGLSKSSSSSSHPSTSMTPSRQERHCSTSSSSSSSSPTTATSSDNETREREDQSENVPSSVPVSSFNVEL